MDFLLEAIAAQSGIQIVDYDSLEWEGDLDMYDAADQVDHIFKQVDIRTSRNKELTLVAIASEDLMPNSPVSKMRRERVVGAVYDSFEEDHDEGVWVYDFDVAADPSFNQGLGSRVGLMLIAAALDRYESISSDMEESYIRVWVVNPKLAKYLEHRLGFEVEGTHGNGSCHMVYHG